MFRRRKKGVSPGGVTPTIGVTDDVLVPEVTAEIDKVAANIMEKTRKEAEVEAARIIAEAKQKAQEIAAEAKIKAEASTRKQVDEILLAANKKAENIEAGAIQRATAFRIKTREETLEEIEVVNAIWTQEVKRACFQLTSSLQDLTAELERILTGWRSKTATLLRSEGPQPKEYEVAAPAPLPEAVELPKEQPTEAKQKPPMAEKEEIGRPGEIPEPAAAIPLKEEIQPARPIAVVSEAQPAESPVKESMRKRYEALLEEGRGLQYAGEVELAFVPPVAPEDLAELYKRLQAIPEVKVLRTVGSWERGTTITVQLDKSLPLIDMLSEMPEVQIRPAPPQKESTLDESLGLLRRRRAEEIKRIEITRRGKTGPMAS